MKAKDLGKILQKHPELEVSVGFEETVHYSELTSDTEDKVEPLNSVFLINGRLVLAAGCYLIGDRLHPPYPMGFSD